MNKYYTPDISEFYVGFEYEILEPGDKWEKRVGRVSFYLRTLLDKGYIRVKYLDEDDIQSFGLKLNERVEGLPDLYRKDIDKDNWWLAMPQYFDGGCEIRVWKINLGSRLSGGEFSGVVKNKSELGRILKMIGYDEF